MTNKTILGADLRISRFTSNREPHEGINLTIEDKTSGITFVELEMSLEEFGRIVTGGGRGQVSMTVRGLQNVGKVREYEAAHAYIPEADYNALIEKVGYSKQREVLAQWLETYHGREGWDMDTYLGSQTSVVFNHKSRQYRLNFGRFRYVEKSNG